MTKEEAKKYVDDAIRQTKYEARKELLENEYDWVMKGTLASSNDDSEQKPVVLRYIRLDYDCTKFEIRAWVGGELVEHPFSTHVDVDSECETKLAYERRSLAKRLLGLSREIYDAAEDILDCAGDDDSLAEGIEADGYLRLLLTDNDALDYMKSLAEHLEKNER